MLTVYLIIEQADEKPEGDDGEKKVLKKYRRILKYNPETQEYQIFPIDKADRAKPYYVYIFCLDKLGSVGVLKFFDDVMETFRKHAPQTDRSDAKRLAAQSQSLHRQVSINILFLNKFILFELPLATSKTCELNSHRFRYFLKEKYLRIQFKFEILI